MSFNNNSDGPQILQMGRVEINTKDFNQKVNPEDLPILATRNLVLFPNINIPITITRENTLALAKAASEGGFPVGIVCQKNPEEENPTVDGLYKYGVAADVYKVITLPDGSHTALIHGRERIRILARGEGAGKVFPGAPSARVKVLSDRVSPEQLQEVEKKVDAMTPMAKDLLIKSQNGDPTLANNICNLTDKVERLNMIVTNLPADNEEKIFVLSQSNMVRRADAAINLVMLSSEKMTVFDEILRKAHSKMSEQQKNVFLQNQMEAIKEELYGGMDADSDVEDLSRRAMEARLPEYVAKAFEKELAKLQRLTINTPDYSVQYAYLETIVDIPWHAVEPDTNIEKATEILGGTHYGLDKVNLRILEQLAVLLSSKQRIKAPILCLVGPPGVGKTSLGRTVAKAMGRVYRRVALGGVHDESEIRGHRRTYIGAMPGRIIKAIKEAGVSNPVLLLDEVDKLGRDHRGDPAAALLEVLDPEQNSTFHDNYVDLDYDLSDVLFIATANDASKIDSPLLDRMEVIELSGYLPEEKVEIAKRHLLPKVLKENGVEDIDSFRISDKAIMAIIEEYTAESGVRSLEKTLSTLVRKMLLARLKGEEFPTVVETEDLGTLLGKAKYNKDRYEEENTAGVVTGLAWTAAGGEILMAEASLSPGKGDKIVITGNLGDVMKESATIALQWVKAHHEALGIPVEKFDQNNLHIHFPEGAIPKDGPSAGITIATAIASAFTGRKVTSRLAMTGEITLRGKVLPVGGIREKILAARRAGIKTIVLSRKNEKDVEEIPSNYIDGLRFEYVDHVEEVMSLALDL